MITDDDALFTRAQQWAEGGGLWRPDRCAPARWEGELFPGLNYRLSELEGSVDLVQIRKVDSQLRRWRTNKRRILSALPVYHELRPQVIHDIDGEMGHHIGFFPESTAELDRVVAVLRAEGVGCHTRGKNAVGNWHACHSMQPILKKMPATSDGWPWNHSYAREVKYSLDACPQTADLVDRQVLVSMDQWWTERDCKQVIAALTKVFDALYTRDPCHENWLTAVIQ